MRLQLTTPARVRSSRFIGGAIASLLVAALGGHASAEEKFDSTFTWYQERRISGGSLTILHPQIDLGTDLGEHVSLGVNYQADIVSGATPSIYAAPRNGEPVDAVTAASEFSDTRHAVSGALGFSGSRSSLSIGYGYGFERDYRSLALTVSGSVDLAGKNTSLQLSYTRNNDEVCDFDNGDVTPLERRVLSGASPCFSDTAETVAREISIDTAQFSIVQNLSPTLVLQLGVFGQIINGFQSNPYRRVRVFELDVQEAHPRVRDRLAIFARTNLAFPGLRSALSIFLRGYGDSWGVESGSVELTYRQYVGRALLLRLRTRVYQQDGAVFFRDARDYQTFGPVGNYFTGDRELAPMRTYIVGGRLSYLVASQDGGSVLGIFDEVAIHINAEGFWAQPLTDNPPGGDLFGVTPDAITGQLGILFRY